MPFGGQDAKRAICVVQATRSPGDPRVSSPTFSQRAETEHKQWLQQRHSEPLGDGERLKLTHRACRCPTARRSRWPDFT